MSEFTLFVDARTIRSGMTGVGIYTYNILNSLASNFPEMKIYAMFLKGETPSAFKSYEIEIIETDVSYEQHPHNEIWMNSKLIKMINKIGVNVYFGPAFLIPWFKTTFKKVVTVHDFIAYKVPENFNFRFREYIKFITKFSAKYSDAIISVSKITKADCIKYTRVKEEKIHLVYEAFSPNFRILDKSEKKSDKVNIPSPFILYIGTIEKRKGPHILLKAFEKIAEDGFPHHLGYIGNPSVNSDYIIQKIKESKFYSSHIHLLPTINKEELVNYYNSAAMLVFPSECEGFGLPPLEAMACGLPVVSSDIDIEKEILGDASTYFSVNNVNSLYESIKKLITDNEYKNLMIEKGLLHCKNYSWDKAAAETHEVLKSVLVK